MSKRYFEDFAAGQSWSFGRWSLDRQDMLDFAARYDPQPIHLDPVYAAGTPYGEVIASGWQTLLMCVRHFIVGLMADAAGLASPGLDDIRWRRPVAPGEEIEACAEVLSVEPSASLPDRGKVLFRIFGRDAEGRDVVSSTGTMFIARRPAG